MKKYKKKLIALIETKIEKQIDQSKARLRWCSMGGATHLKIKFNSTEQGEERKNTLKMKPLCVRKPFQKVLHVLWCIVLPLSSNSQEIVQDCTCNKLIATCINLNRESNPFSRLRMEERFLLVQLSGICNLFYLVN